VTRLPLLLASLFAASLAQRAPAQTHDHGHAAPQPDLPEHRPEATDAAGAASAAAASNPGYAADALFDPADMARARAQLRDEHGGFTTQMILADRFESRAGEDSDAYLWDLQGWRGNDLQRFWWKTEGTAAAGGSTEDAEVQALYSRALTPWFDLQAGLRQDLRPTPRRTHAVIGIQGLLPYVFEIDAAAFLSDHGEWTARVEAEYDLRIRQRLVLQPRVELNFSAQTIPELALGTGLGSVAAGLRLRYEIRRELTPYVGVEWVEARGGTADFVRAAGDDPDGWEAVVGLRAWF
jgi:copper resistance protein B